MRKLLLIFSAMVLPYCAAAQSVSEQSPGDALARSMFLSVIDCDRLFRDEDINPVVASGLCAAVSESMVFLVENGGEAGFREVLGEVFESNAVNALTEDHVRTQVILAGLYDPETRLRLNQIFRGRLGDEIAANMIEGAAMAMAAEITSKVAIHYFGDEWSSTIEATADGSFELIAIAMSSPTVPGLVVTNVQIWSENFGEMYTLGSDLRDDLASGTDLRSALSEAEFWRLTYLESLARGYVSGPKAGEMVSGEDRFYLTARLREIMEQSLAEMPELINTIENAERYIGVFDGALITWADLVDEAVDVVDVLAGPIADAVVDEQPLDGVGGAEAFTEGIEVEPFDGFLGPPDASDIVSGVDLGPANRWGPGVVAPSGHDVWGLTFDSDAAPYHDRIRAMGLPLDAVQFSTAYAEASPWNDEVLATNFEELGVVDLVFVAPGIELGTSDRWRAPAYVNGDFGLEIAAPIIRDLSSTFTDATSRSMLARNPTASAVYTGVLHRQLPSGAQRFIEVTDLTNGCRVCDSVGTAVRFVDFSVEGRLVSRRSIGLVDNTASEGFGVGAEGWAGVSFASNMKALQYRLNMLGYEAGAMDGFAGPQTRQALMEFQVEHCLTPTGQPNAPTVRKLATANGFTAACAGTNLPNGISANTPLLAGVYVTDPQICSSSTDTLQVYSVFSNNDERSEMFENLFFITDEGVEPLDGGCQTGRTDIVDGFTRVRGTCTGEVGVTQPMDQVWNIEANDRFITSGAGQEKTSVRCSNSSPLSVYHGFDNPREVTQVNDANGLQGCTPSGLPSFPERMRPVEDSSTHSGRTASGNNWTLRLFSPGLDFGDSQFTNSSGTTVNGLWRTTDTGICQSYNNQESWSCHDIFACEGETNRFVLRNSAGEFTSVIEASDGPSYELGAGTTPELANSTSVSSISPAISNAQNLLPSTMPACRGLSAFNHICKTVDFYERPVQAGDSELERFQYEQLLNTYNSRTADGVVTLDEVAIGEVPGEMFGKDRYRVTLRSLWLELNGLDQAQPVDRVFPQGPVTMAVARSSDETFPFVTPSCRPEARHGNCFDITLNSSANTSDGVAMYQLFMSNWRDFPDISKILERNGLTDAGITLFSPVLPGEYDLRLVN